MIVWDALRFRHHSIAPFCLETKSGAKNSRQIQMLRWICRANAQARFIQLRRFILIVCQALHVCYTAGAVIAPLMITIFT
jgi:hypothetical protein